MLSMNELRPGVAIELDGEPYKVLEAQHQKIARRGSTLSAKLKHIRTGKVLEKTFQPADRFPEPDVKLKEAKFQYRTRDQFFFVLPSGEKVGFSQDALGETVGYLTKDLPVQIMFIDEEAVSVELPIKVSLKVTEAPPNFKGDTAQGGQKEVEVETGARVKAPMFVEEGDVIEVNTHTGLYVRRV